MSSEDDLVGRSGPLKAELVAFGRSTRFAREYRSAHADRFGDADPRTQHDFINFLDRFVLEHRTRDGRTVVEQFVAARPDLPQTERTMLLGWRDVVEGVFEVQRYDGETAIMVNLVDELTYRVRSNVGLKLLDAVPPGTVMFARVAPVAGSWLMSGAIEVAPSGRRDEMRRAAIDIVHTCPAAVFRNPEKLALGWRLHHAARGHFIDFFGADLVVVAGCDLAGRMDAFWDYHTQQIGASQPAAPDQEATSPNTQGCEHQHPVPRTPVPPTLASAVTVGVVFDEVEGLSYLPEFRLLQEVFADPALFADRRHREAVSGHLKSDSISPISLRRLAERDPDRASQVFAQLLRKPHFVWRRDGEALLRRYKASFFDRPPLPGVTPMSDRQTAFLRQ